ncbi:hypothetical protein Ddye_016436 [Dipteronia dyeriana]|uniref:Uncharacterized protein n=1 Tax=Dipteronia dyeriana TaxID=168575 RepID=A0AAD9X0A8_9ROSI|nr:hypothetical protein Ddye_016436 [Dipteronia dyeriana]
MNVEYQKFRDVVISPDLMDMFDKMFKGSTTIGNFVMIPSSTILLEETVGDSEHDKQTIDRESDEASQGNQDKRKKRTNDESEINKGVVGGSKGNQGKLGGAVKFSKQMDRLVEVVESKSTVMSVHRSSQGTSIAEVMEVVATLHGEEKDNVLPTLDLYLYELFDGIMIIAGIGNKNAQERFQRSGEMMSRYFDVMLDILYQMAKDCIGAIDGVHVQASISSYDQVPYIGRKGIPTQNIMAICNFDMQFRFACAGWESSAHDSRVFLLAQRDPQSNFPKPSNDFDENANCSREEINEEMEVNTYEEDSLGRREMEILRNSIA